jgi:hypothetical protein
MPQAQNNYEISVGSDAVKIVCVCVLVGKGKRPDPLSKDQT